MPSEVHIVRVHDMPTLLRSPRDRRSLGLPLANTRAHTSRPWDQAPAGPPGAGPLGRVARARGRQTTSSPARRIAAKRDSGYKTYIVTGGGQDFVR
jgi:hypothetical protein